MNPRFQRRLALTTFLAAAFVAACVLNPQPLPPGDEDSSAADDRADASLGSQTPNPADPGVGDGGGAAEGGDAGDAGDAGDGG